MCLKVNDPYMANIADSLANARTGRKNYFVSIFVYLFLPGVPPCPAWWSTFASFTGLQPSTETYGYWPPVTRCFIEKSILGNRERILYSYEVISLYKILNYLGVFLRETHLVGGKRMHLKVKIPYERASAKESSIECVMNYTFPR